MKFVSIREFRSASGTLCKQLKASGELVLTSHGKPVALVTSINEASFESTLRQVQHTRAIEAVAKIRAKARRDGLHTMTMAEINKEIRLARQRSKR